jgi:hypothetical protein
VGLRNSTIKNGTMLTEKNLRRKNNQPAKANTIPIRSQTGRRHIARRGSECRKTSREKPDLKLDRRKEGEQRAWARGLPTTASGGGEEKLSSPREGNHQRTQYKYMRTRTPILTCNRDPKDWKAVTLVSSEQERLLKSNTNVTEDQ